MAINPIQIYSGGQANILEALNGAQNVIGSMFDRAIQIGRDSVNNQMKQDGDLQQQRQFETSMFQRRAEGLQQNNEDAQRNARNAFEFDTKFAYGAGQDAIQNQRLAANDIFSQGMQEKNYDLTASNMEADNLRENSRLQLTQDVAANERAAQENLAQQRLSVVGGNTSVEQLLAPPPKNIVDEMNVGGFNTSILNTGGNTTNATSAQPASKFTTQQVYDAKAVFMNPKATPADRKMAAAIINPQSGEKELTANQIETRDRARRGEERTIANNEQMDARYEQANATAALKVKDERLSQAVNTDTVAFNPMRVWMAKAKDPETGERLYPFVSESGEVDAAKITDPKIRADFAASDKDPYAYQLTVAKGYETAEEYIAAGQDNRKTAPKLTKSQQAIRKEVWERATGNVAGGSDTQNQAAMEWLKTNPNHEKAAAVRAKLGIK